MLKTVEQEAAFCDFCGKKTDAYYHCDVCGKHHCYDCRQKHIVEYPHSVYCSGSGDMVVCKGECDDKFVATAIGMAYLEISRLRREQAAISETFDAKCKAATERAKQLREEQEAEEEARVTT